MPTFVTGSSAGVTVAETDPTIVTATGLISGSNIGANFTNDSQFGSLTVAGMVTAISYGVYMNENDHLNVTSTGSVIGLANPYADGVFVGGSGSSVMVSGLVQGNDFGIYQGAGYEVGVDVTITSTGVVRGGSDGNGTDSHQISAAILTASDGAIIKNFGTIIADYNPTIDNRIAFANGTLDTSYADNVDLSMVATSTFVNGGTIIGDMLFAAGEDLYRAVKGGTVDGLIDMGVGSDRMIGSWGDEVANGGNGSDVMRGRKGDDSLVGANGDDTLAGGRGEDVLKGGAGSDDMIGGRGDDRMTGGGDADTFIFAGTFGQDVITDFKDNNAEKIDLRGVQVITGWNDLKNNHLENTGQGAVISDGDGNAILLSAFAANDLDSGDFIF